MNDSGINDSGINDSRNNDSTAASEPTRPPCQIHEIEQKPGILSGCRTPARPAAATQVIENKNTIGMNEIRDAQNQGKCPQDLAYHDIS
jgi:hypothetical protein